MSSKVFVHRIKSGSIYITASFGLQKEGHNWATYIRTNAEYVMCRMH